MNTDQINTPIIDTFFPVVAIGTAPTEIDILTHIITDLPENSGIAYLILENLAQPQTDNLAHLLAQHTKIQVSEIVKGNVHRFYVF